MGTRNCNSCFSFPFRRSTFVTHTPARTHAHTVARARTLERMPESFDANRKRGVLSLIRFCICQQRRRRAYNAHTHTHTAATPSADAGVRRRERRQQGRAGPPPSSLFQMFQMRCRDNGCDDTDARARLRLMRGVRVLRNLSLMELRAGLLFGCVCMCLCACVLRRIVPG